MDKNFCFQQIHIDAARNSTDDFNPFHDPHKFQVIRGNPYDGTIVLGFQLECLIEYRVNLHRDAHAEHEYVMENGLHFSNYQLTFANALLEGESFQVEVKPTLVKSDPPSLSNRIAIRKDGSLVMIGYRRETREPLYFPGGNFPVFADLPVAPDRTNVGGTSYFMKRKFISAGNAKNFVAGSLCDQHYYFDVLENRVHYPDIYPCSLISCALLEKALNEGHDFLANPMVYMAHNISVDRRLSRSLRSNEPLHIMVHGPKTNAGAKGLGKSELPQQIYSCVGLIRESQTLYYAEVHMAPLAAILAAGRSSQSQV